MAPTSGAPVINLSHHCDPSCVSFDILNGKGGGVYLTNLNNHGVNLVRGELELVSGETVGQAQLHGGHVLVSHAWGNRNI